MFKLTRHDSQQLSHFPTFIINLKHLLGKEEENFLSPRLMKLISNLSRCFINLSVLSDEVKTAR